MCLLVMHHPSNLITHAKSYANPHVLCMTPEIRFNTLKPNFFVPMAPYRAASLKEGTLIKGKFLRCVHTAHAEAEMGRVRFPNLQSNLWCDLLTVQWPREAL